MGGLNESADIRAATEGLARAIKNGEVAMSGRDPVNFAAALLEARHPNLPVPSELCAYSLLLGMVVGGGTYRAVVDMED